MTDAPIIPQADIDEINQAQADIANAKGTLMFALRAGELLEKAGNEVKRLGGDFEKWLKAYCPNIAVSTARLYRRFHKERTTLEVRAGGANALAALGIRQARELLESEETKTKKAAAKQKTKKKRDQDKALLKVAKDGGSADLTTMIQAEPAPDVVAKAIKDAGLEPEAVRELARQLDDSDAPDLPTLLNEAEPADIVDAFDPEVWEAEDLDKIAEGIMALAEKIRTGEADTPAPAPDKAKQKPASRRL
jgi:hypothetical protein